MKALVCICVLAFAGFLHSAAHAKTWHYTMLHNFCTQDNCADGTTAGAGLVADAKGNFFGITEIGGAHNVGVIFELERQHGNYTFKVVHDFCFDCTEGAFPAANLIADVNGNLYGTTLGGGTHDCGVAFRFTPKTKKWKVLHDFCTQDGDGNTLNVALTYAGKNSGAFYDGVSPLYGATGNGGANGKGTVFSLAPDGRNWTLTTLYAFCAQANCADGEFPSGDVLVDDAGNLFGNVGGGITGGAVYELSPNGARMSERLIHTFCSGDNCHDGEGPLGALVQTANGEILGTTENANGSEGGAIFKLTPNSSDWDESVVHVFCGRNCHDGYAPSGGLAMDAKENIYGVNGLGGTGEQGVGGGTAYRLRDGKLTILYQFCSEANCADGRLPTGPLARDAHGNIFGITSQGGPVTAAGTVFELSP